MPNLAPWINQNNSNINEEHIATNKCENHLLSIRAKLQKLIHPKSHPTYMNVIKKL